MKILIIGAVGTGKTTLGKQLSKKYNIKHYEIDSIVHDDNEGGTKRTEEEQNRIINQIDEEKDWIIEGTLRKNLYYLLEISEKIIYLDIPKRTRNFRILTRYIKQKLKIEKSNYKPTLKMLKLMYKWSGEYENNKQQLAVCLNKYIEKLEIIN